MFFETFFTRRGLIFNDINYMNKLTLLSSVAAAAMLALPIATADAASRGSGARASVSAGSRGFSSGHFAGRPGSVNRAGATRFNRWNGNGNGHWTNGDWRHHHHGRTFVGFYPYWSPWWDYGYGYGYGYGYYPYGDYYGGDYATRGGSLAVNVQAALAREGYYRGPIDGVIGARTRTAIRAYERANGLHVDGLIDQRLLETMGLA